MNYSLNKYKDEILDTFSDYEKDRSTSYYSHIQPSFSVDC